MKNKIIIIGLIVFALTFPSQALSKTKSIKITQELQNIQFENINLNLKKTNIKTKTPEPVKSKELQDFTRLLSEEGQKIFKITKKLINSISSWLKKNIGLTIKQLIVGIVKVFIAFLETVLKIISKVLETA
ncbi:MAG: hypothetical protein ABEI53_01695 [Candidatus Magasanikbacteria bacterium]